jgi:twitching motility protein PilT
MNERVQKLNTQPMPFNLFVHKIVLHNRLMERQQLEECLLEMEKCDEQSLLERLVSRGRLSPVLAGMIEKKYRDYLIKQGITPNDTENQKSDREAESAEERSGTEKAEPTPDAAHLPSRTPGGALPASLDTRLSGLLEEVRQSGGSDLIISVGSPPLMRKHGILQTLNGPALRAEDTMRLLFSIFSEKERNGIIKTQGMDKCLDMKGKRYRACVIQQRLGWEGSFRVIASSVPSFEKLGLPMELVQLMEYREGLILITGPASSGKSTTLGAFIQLINNSRSEHIITLEDPIEFVYSPVKSHISQREAGLHTQDFPTALRAALREDPDVIVVGELRDRETTSLAVTAAETGHLVFTTLHTTGASQTIQRLLDFFPPDQRNQVRIMISESIRGIVCQRLVRRKDGQGMALAVETLFNIDSIANLIREDRLFQIPNVIQINSRRGMRLLDESLKALVESDVISGQDAYFAANDQDLFRQFAPLQQILHPKDPPNGTNRQTL